MLHRSLCALATVAGLTIGSTAEAHPPYAPPIYRHSYYEPVRVYYRSCVAEPWRVYASYRYDWQARPAAHHLRHRGYDVLVRGCR